MIPMSACGGEKWRRHTMTNPLSRMIRIAVCVVFFFAAFAGAEETTSIRIVVTGNTMGQLIPCQH
jgi:hypothetical protein